jgi:hypothetical protein
VADRESDMQELMNEARRRNYATDYLIRAKYNRNLVGGDKLWVSVAQQTPLGQIELILEANADRKARKVCQRLTAQRVTLPKRKGKLALETTIILAQEETPPAGESPLSGNY